jgi:hypothetical protein
MTSSFTTNKSLEKPANGDYVDTWDVPVNGDMDIIDQAFGGTTSINASGGSATLTASQYRSLILTITGVLTNNVTYTIPLNVGGEWIVRNATTGNFDVIFTVFGSAAPVTLLRSKLNYIYSDGTNIRSLTNQIVEVAQGGTGSASLTANNVLLGNGTNALQVVAPGLNGNVLTSNGTTWISQAVGSVTAVNSISFGSTGFTPSTATTGAVTVAGTLNIANGGTGATSASQARTSLDVPSSTGSGASGTWSININGSLSGGSVAATTGSFSGGATAVTTAGNYSFRSVAKTDDSSSMIQFTNFAQNTEWALLSVTSAKTLNVVSTGFTFNGNVILNAANFNTYAPTLTGTGASGTWGINITGNAATVTNGLTTSNYNSYAPTLTGTGASGTWGISISGNAATASYATNAGFATTAGNGGVTSIGAGNGISVNTNTGAVTVSQDIYTGTDKYNTSFPIGTVILCQTIARAEIASTIIAAVFTSPYAIYQFYEYSGFGNILTGTWRARSGTSSCCGALILLQRVA